MNVRSTIVLGERYDRPVNNTDGYDANLYTSRFRKEPHPGIYNPVGSDALFVVGRCSQQMTVNDGWFDATVTAIVDGRNGASVEVPFVSEKTDWVLQVTGEKAAALAAALKVGDAVRINANVSIGSVSKQIIMHNSSMYRFLNGGNWNAVNDATLMPATCIGADQAGHDRQAGLRGRPHEHRHRHELLAALHDHEETGASQCDPFRRRRLHDVVEMGERRRRDRQQALRLEGRAQLHELHACQDQVARNP